MQPIYKYYLGRKRSLHGMTAQRRNSGLRIGMTKGNN